MTQVDKELPQTMTPTQIAATYPPIVIEAYWWLKTYCRHWATLYHDWQTLDGQVGENKETAERYMIIMLIADLVVFKDRPPKQKPDRCGLPNFKLKELTPYVPPQT